MSDGRLIVAVVINGLLTVAQLIGGMVAGSLALVADAMHNFSDAASLGIALFARRVARRPADELHTFGYRRAEIIGALINLTTLIVVALYLLGEAALRFFEREPINGWIVVWVAGLALVIDLGTAMLTYAMSKDNLNVRAAFVHNLSDAGASVGVMVAGTLILLFGWYWTDLAVTVLISGYMLWQGAVMMRQTIHILMQGVPEGIEPGALAKKLGEIEGIEELHHIHVWQLDEHHRSLEAHVVIREDDLVRMEELKAAIRGRLAEYFGIRHSTLEFETVEAIGEEGCGQRRHHG